MEYMTPLAALVISMTTLTITVLSNRNKAAGEFVETLEGRIEKLEQTLEDCEERCKSHLNRIAELTAENTQLMHSIIRLSGQGGEGRT